VEQIVVTLDLFFIILFILHFHHTRCFVAVWDQIPFVFFIIPARVHSVYYLRGTKCC